MARQQKNRTHQEPSHAATLGPPDLSPKPGQEHVQSVLRAMSLLKAFSDDGEVFLSLTELARRTGMHKPTALRLARSLALSQFLVQRRDGAWRLGPAAGWIGSRYQAQFDVGAVIEPVLRKLAAETGESASFYVHEGNMRSCLMRCDGLNARRDHPRTGELLPLDRGAPGRVILAALGEPGDLYEQIRRQGFYWARGERASEAAAVAAAVRGRQGTVLGAISTSGPADRLTPEALAQLARPTIEAARQLGIALGGVPATALRATWHP